VVGSRWCWVPGAIGPRPVYAPALVAFVGGADFGFTIASGPGIAWYPLGPGEVWRPSFYASPRYVRSVNRYLVTDSRFYNTGPNRFMHRSDAVTAARIDDFHRGRAVQQRWSRLSPSDVARVQSVAPPMPIREARRGERPREQTRFQPQAQAPVQSPRVQSAPVQRFAQPIPAPVQPREQIQRPQPWRGGEEGGYQSRWTREPRGVQRQAQRGEDGDGRGGHGHWRQ
jgi:hypothetical protein